MKTRYGADSERYLESGIVQLSQLKQHPHPAPFFHLSQQCRKDQKELEKRFRHKVCKPWLPENRLKAEVSSSAWAGAKRGAKLKRIDGLEFPCFDFQENAEIFITEGIAMLYVARTSSAWGLLETFDKLEPRSRWWILDFFCDDGSHSRQAASHCPSEALRRRLCARSKPQYENSLAQYLNQEAGLVSSREGMPEVFRLLDQIPAMWTTKSYNFVSDIRKSWCYEEVRNYLQHTADQWQDITLQWHPVVARSFDPDSIAIVQSRAPLLSGHDRDYITLAFEQGRILSELTDVTLRKSVMTAIRRQGPILTLATFRQDVRLLVTAVHELLTSVLKPMSDNDTLRNRMHRIFAKEFDALCESEESLLARTTREAFVARCYQDVFLHTLRTAPLKRLIDEPQLRKLAKQVSTYFLLGDREIDSWDSGGEDVNIAFRTPATALQSHSDFEDVAVGKRHGVSLFRSDAAKNCLYSDQLCGEHSPGIAISQSFMAKHIASIFISGGATYPGALLPSSGPSSLAGSTFAATAAAPSNEAFNSMHSLCFPLADDGSSSISGQSSCRTNESDLEIRSISRRYPHIQTASVNSMAASVVTLHTSPVNTPSEQVRKRHFPMSLMETPPMTVKRWRSHDFQFNPPSSNVFPIEVRSPNRAASGGSSIGQPKSIMHETAHHDFERRLVSPIIRSSSEGQQSPWRPARSQSSAYSPDGHSSVSSYLNFALMRSRGVLEAHEGQLKPQIPFLSDESRTVFAQLSQYDQSAPGTPGYQPPYDQNSPLFAGSFSHEHVAPRPNGEHAAVGRPEAVISVKPSSRTVRYVLSGNQNIFYPARADGASIERFVQNQKKIDPLSTFHYKLKGFKQYAVGPDQLCKVIHRYELETVYVDSIQLANTDSEKPLS